ncbi:MAG: endonuclease III domain-containing protein [Patescibacteria group bacterium]
MKMKPLQIYNRLYRAFGPQHWWPVTASGKSRIANRDDQRLAISDKPFEVCVGAILTQNTAWINVEKAIANLIAARVMDPTAVHTISPQRLERLIRPAGYFRQKAKKLKIFSRWVLDEFGGDFERMRRVPLPKLRESILSVWGIGPETADSILLYALGKPIFVVDAYTKRLCDCFKVSFKTYGEYQRFFQTSIPKSAKIFNEYHALIVAWGKVLSKDPKRAFAVVKD